MRKKSLKFDDIMDAAESIEKAQRLPIRLRVAWGVFVADKALGLFSSYFLKKYHQQECIDYGWEFASSGKGDASERERLMKLIEPIDEEAEKDGYNRELTFIGPLILEETVNKRGSIIAAVEYAGFAFALHQLYRSGLSGLDEDLPGELIDRLQLPFFDFAWRVLEAANASKSLPIKRVMFKSIKLDVPLEKINLKAAGKRPKPPVHEVKKNRP
jgi:hypothetical protein